MRVTPKGANELLGRLLPAHNRRFGKAAREATDAHRPLGPRHDLAAILSIQEERVASPRPHGALPHRFYQLLPPAHPGERGGRVVMEQRLDGSLAIRFRYKYLKYREAARESSPGGSTPRPPEFSALAADARGEKESPRLDEERGPSGMQPVAGRSGRTPAEPYPPGDAADNNDKKPYRPAEDHPWRRPYKRKK